MFTSKRSAPSRPPEPSSLPPKNRTLARMGALVGGGTPEQIEAVGMYFEMVGTAFQIMDDVLNLRGLYSKAADKLKKGTVLKRLGEDIVDGKVTMPVCKAFKKIVE